MERWWWMEAMAVGLAVMTLLTFLLWPAVVRSWSPGADQAIERAPGRDDPRPPSPLGVKRLDETK
jgi:hypothetical protein